MLISWPQNTTESGIYIIRNNTNNNIYVGSSYNINKRRINHFLQLKKNRHQNKHLQASYNLYGESSFDFEVVLLCHRDLLLFYEQQFIDQLNPEYNLYRVAGSPVGYKHKDKTKVKISESLKGKKKIIHNKRVYSLEDKAKYAERIKTRTLGKIVSDQTKQKLSYSHKGKVKRIYKVTLLSPQNEVIETSNISQFCTERGLDASHFYKLIHGKRKTVCGGWKLL